MLNLKKDMIMKSLGNLRNENELIKFNEDYSKALVIDMKTFKPTIYNKVFFFYEGSKIKKII